jgi:hypothetical protein
MLDGVFGDRQLRSDLFDSPAATAATTSNSRRVSPNFFARSFTSLLCVSTRIRSTTRPTSSRQIQYSSPITVRMLLNSSAVLDSFEVTPRRPQCSAARSVSESTLFVRASVRTAADRLESFFSTLRPPPGSASRRKRAKRRAEPTRRQDETTTLEIADRVCKTSTRFRPLARKGVTVSPCWRSPARWSSRRAARSARADRRSPRRWRGSERTLQGWRRPRGRPPGRGGENCRRLARKTRRRAA